MHKVSLWVVDRFISFGLKPDGYGLILVLSRLQMWLKKLLLQHKPGVTEADVTDDYDKLVNDVEAFLSSENGCREIHHEWWISLHLFLLDKNASTSFTNLS